MSNMLQDHTHCSACLLYAPWAECFSNMVLEHIQLRIFSRLIMVQDHTVWFWTIKSGENYTKALIQISYCFTIQQKEPDNLCVIWLTYSVCLYLHSGSFIKEYKHLQKLFVFLFLCSVFYTKWFKCLNLSS